MDLSTSRLRRRRSFITTAGTIAAAATLALAATGTAQAQTTTDKATATSSSTIVSLNLADGTSLNLLVDTLSSTLSGGTLGASNTLLPIKVASTSIPALAFESPSVSTSLGGASETETISVPLTSPLTDGGLIPLALKSANESGVAVSSLSAQLADLNIGAGLASISSITDAAENRAGVGAASTTRAVSINGLGLLDLSGLLDGLGLPLELLPQDIIEGLVGDLDLAIPTGGLSLAQADALAEMLQSPGGIAPTSVPGDDVAAVADLAEADIVGAAAALTELDALLGALNVAAAAEGDPIDPTTLLDDLAVIDDLNNLDPTVLSTALPTLCDDGNAVYIEASAVIDVDALCAAGNGSLAPEDLIAALTEVLENAQGILAEVLGQSVTALELTPLLQVNAITAQLTAVAKATTALSSATVAATYGGIEVGGLDLPAGLGDDLVPAIQSATATVNGVLAGIDPRLGSLVTLDLLKETTSITSTAGTVTSLASLDLVSATITPPAELAAIISEVQGAGAPIGDILGLAAAAAEADVLTGQLTGPTTLSAGSFDQSASFTPGQVAGTTQGQTNTLPATGSEGTLYGLIALAVLSGSIVMRRRVVQAS